MVKDTNPFRFGALALDEAFTDRTAEVAELRADGWNGQDVVIFAPRRYGKTSLVRRVAQKLVSSKVLVAEVNLMKTPTKEKLAERLAETIHEQIASPLARAKDRGARIFQGLRIKPTVTVDTDDGSLGFSFAAGQSPDDLDATLERLFELPARLAADRGRKAVLVLDEFQEIADIDPDLPKLLRSVFQEQPDVSHIYLGSRRHMMERIFNDENEPFWRSAKRVELDVIDPELFAPYIEKRFRATGKDIDETTLGAIGSATRGHPYATQELCYFLWAATAHGETATAAHLEGALAAVLRSEHAHFSALWDRATSNQRQLLLALAKEEGHPLTDAYRTRHRLKNASSTQKALEALELAELIARERGRAWISEPFYAEWIRANAE
jgi:AAA+ ATPase superfamily predicted ATPase